MSSILTNNGAMVALQTLKMVNKNLGQTQNAIATGKDVATAKDNSAVWAISKVMESDVKSFNAIKDSLALGESTVAVARNASETVTDLLIQIQEKVVAAQEDNVERDKIDADVTALKDQIVSVVSAAQFNGLNLVNGDTASAKILSSLDRDSSGAVKDSSITVNAQNLSTGGYSAKNVLDDSDNASTDGDVASFSLDKSGGSGNLNFNSATDNFAVGDKISVTVGGQSVSYTVQASDIDAVYNAPNTDTKVAAGLKSQIDALGIKGLTITQTTDELAFATAAADQDLTVSAQFTNAGSGGLGALSSIDVTTKAGASAALGTITGLIDTAIDASAAFGSVQNRIETQKEFIANLTDSFKSGIGSLVDADMEETSARLQALQVQQQLATQSLSIANQAPQSILSLFR
ncbi:flagellin N-terminal helical domain-containing protein [Ruegeria profundi]|uniref:flagellin N-terminal helical domain-containing protein n=1 Tax=Ruegeria profundi TaxID=1685378 RepID=UPI001CD55830|nr:flagellin [Ruegeria profundi]MCA0929348.1 flagellin [Ruegeria profundi]